MAASQLKGRGVAAVDAIAILLAWRSSNMVLHTQHACDVALGNLYVPAEAFLLMPESVTHPT
jgi:hypothetical protein